MGTRQGRAANLGIITETPGSPEALAPRVTLRKPAYAVELSRRSVLIVQQNVVFSLVTKGLFLLLGTFGFVGLAVVVLADMGIFLLTTANGMRLSRTKTVKD